MSGERKSIGDILSQLGPPETAPAAPAADTPPVTPEKRVHPDTYKVRADIAYFGSPLMESLKRALEDNPGEVDLRKLSTSLPDGTKREEVGLAIPVWIDLGDPDTDREVFFTGIGPSGSEFATAPRLEDEASTEETLEASPLDIEKLDIENLYRLQGSMVTTALSLDPVTRGPDSLQPVRGTLTQEGDSYYAETEEGKRYRVPMVDIKNQQLKDHSKVAVLVPTTDSDFSWASVVPIKHYPHMKRPDDEDKE